MGDVRDFTNFMGAVIDEKAFDEQRLPRAGARVGDDRRRRQGRRREGWFVPPTLIETDDPGPSAHAARRSSARS